MEILFNRNKEWLNLLSFQNLEIQNLYKNFIRDFGTYEAINWSADVKDWELLNENEQHYIGYSIACLAGSNHLNEKLRLRLMNEAGNNELQSFNEFASRMGVAQSDMLLELLTLCVSNSRKGRSLADTMACIKSIRNKEDWVKRKTGSKQPVDWLIPVAVTHRIFFSGSHCALSWLQRRGFMPGLTGLYQRISTFKQLNSNFICQIYLMIGEKLAWNDVLHILKEAVDYEKHFIAESLPVTLTGLNQNLINQFVENTADELLTEFGYEKYYHALNPFDFITRPVVPTDSEIFENRASIFLVNEVEKNKLPVSREDDSSEYIF